MRTLVARVKKILRSAISAYRWYVCKDFLMQPTKMPKGLVFSQRARVFPRNNIVIGENVYIGEYSNVSTSPDPRARVTIGRDTLIANHVLVVSGNHRFEDKNIPIRLQGEGSQRPLTIGEDCWIASGSIVLGGAVIPRGSILGAGSVAVKAFDSEFSLYVGNPARFVRVCRG